MRQKKKISFLLDMDWVLKTPIDSEHKQYVLLDYLQKINKKLDKLEVYPTFIELSLHLANIQTLIKENKYITTKKKFETPDDEVLLSDLEFLPIPTLTSEEFEEYERVLKFSSPKIFDYFNIAKSIWQMAYEAVSVSIKRNKEQLINEWGFFYYFDKFNNKTYVWEYNFKKPSKTRTEIKQYVNLIYQDESGKLDIKSILDHFPKWTQSQNREGLPIFEVFASEEYPLNETLLPIFKRKIQSYIAQTINVETIKKISM